MVIGADLPASAGAKVFFALDGAHDDRAECTWQDLQSVTVASVVRQMVRDERAESQAPAITWDSTAIAADSARVLADGSIKPLLRAKQAARAPLRMQPDLIAAALGTYPDQARLYNLALGMIIPKRDGFVADPERPLSLAYRQGKAQIVHAKVQKDHGLGHVVVLNAAAAAVVRAHDNVNDCPMGHVAKRDEPPPRLGRVTTNASAGRQGKFAGSLNAMTDQATVKAMYGPANVTDVGEVARMCYALDRQGFAVAVATADAKSAFNCLSQTLQASCDTVSSVHFGASGIQPSPPPARTRTGTSGAHGLVASLVVMFGGTAAPAAWHVAQRAICWIADTQPLDWWHGGFEQWKAQPPRVRTEPAPIGEVLQSLLAAMAFVLSPRDPKLAPLNLKKIVGPGRRRLYAGWVIDCVAKTVALSRRGLRKLAYALYQSFPARAESFEFTEVRSAVHVLLHYAALRPAARAFLAEMWHLLHVHSTRQTPIPVSSTLLDDLAWWRAALDVVWHSSTATFAVSWQDAAGKCKPCVQPETDASGFGGGLYVPAYSSPPRPHCPAAAWRIEWSKEEAAAAALQQGAVHINILEYAVFVFTLLLIGPDVKAFTAKVDNTTAVSWARKARAKAPAAHDLARVAALAEFAFSTSSRRADAQYLPGECQVFADPLSRWDEAERRAAYRALSPQAPEPRLVSTRAKGRPGRARRLIRDAITGTLRAQPGWLGRLAPRLRSGW